jgi:hypothetical protein
MSTARLSNHARLCNGRDLPPPGCLLTATAFVSCLAARELSSNLRIMCIT